MIAAAIVGGVVGVPELMDQLNREANRPVRSKYPTTYTQHRCRTSKHPVTVRLSSRRYPRATSHIHDSLASGHPQVLHLSRSRAPINRRRSLRGIPTRRGFDRDEYPPASTREGGYGAHVRYISPHENRGAGSTMRRQLARYCDGQAFRIKITDY